jgi:xylose isomerase
MSDTIRALTALGAGSQDAIDEAIQRTKQDAFAEAIAAHIAEVTIDTVLHAAARMVRDDPLPLVVEERHSLGWTSTIRGRVDADQES